MSQLDRIEEDIKTIKELLGAEPVNAKKTSVFTGGISEPNEYGCIMFLALDKKKKEWLESDDPFKRHVAIKTPDFYGLLLKGVELEQDVFNQVKTNQDALWLASTEGIMTSEFYEMLGKYHNTVTDEYKFKAPHPYDSDYDEWETTNWQQVKAIKNHATVAFGNYSDPLNPEWYDKFYSKISSTLIAKMDSDYQALKLVD